MTSSNMRRSESGLNGHLLLLHLGTTRQDKVYAKLGELIDELLAAGLCVNSHRRVSRRIGCLVLEAIPAQARHDVINKGQRSNQHLSIRIYVTCVTAGTSLFLPPTPCISATRANPGCHGCMDRHGLRIRSSESITPGTFAFPTRRETWRVKHDLRSLKPMVEHLRRYGPAVFTTLDTCRYVRRAISPPRFRKSCFWRRAYSPPHDNDVRLETEIGASRVSRRQIRRATEVSKKGGLLLVFQKGNGSDDFLSLRSTWLSPPRPS